MTMLEGRRRPGAVTFAVVLMYLGGISQIVLGVLMIFLRYAPEAQARGVALAVTLFGAATILFGLLVISLASGVARGSAPARAGATVVMVLGLVSAVGHVSATGGGDWSAVLPASTTLVLVVVPLWTGRGRRYFAGR